MPLVFARFRPGVIGESRRVVHLIALTDPADLPNVRDVSGAGALCGERLPPGKFDVLDAVQGMPCAACLLQRPGYGPRPPSPLFRTSA